MAYWRGHESVRTCQSEPVTRQLPNDPFKRDAAKSPRVPYLCVQQRGGDLSGGSGFSFNDLFGKSVAYSHYLQVMISIR
jgi:hypothetical protein